MHSGSYRCVGLGVLVLGSNHQPYSLILSPVLDMSGRLLLNMSKHLVLWFLAVAVLQVRTGREEAIGQEKGYTSPDHHDTMDGNTKTKYYLDREAKILFDGFRVY